MIQTIDDNDGESYEDDDDDELMTLTSSTMANKSELARLKKQVIEYIKSTTMSVVCALANLETPTIGLRSVKADNSDKSSNSREIGFFNKRTSHQFVLYMKLLDIIQNLIENNQYSTKRDIYYQYKHLFKSQASLDVIINHVSRTIGVPRSSLNIISTPKGVVVGDLDIYLTNHVHIDCRVHQNGVLIPNLFHSVEKLSTKCAAMVLIVEKHATFMRLVDDKFLQKYPAILITGKGEPDINTRKLCHLLWKEFGSKLGFFCLTDANPFGIQIMSTYKYGSKPLAYINSSLDVPVLEWIGLKLSDLHIVRSKDGRTTSIEMMPLSQSDTRLARNLLERLENLEEFELRNELELMVEKNTKAELQYLQNFGNSFLCDVYLRAKLDSFLKTTLCLESSHLTKAFYVFIANKKKSLKNCLIKKIEEIE